MTDPAQPPAPSLKLRRRDRRDTEERLFQAGVEVMSAVGYDAATTRRIAEAAGVNEQLISRYFGGKQGLLLAILRRYAATETDRELAARPVVAETLQQEIAAFLAEADFPADREPFSRLALVRALLDPGIAGAIDQLRCECYRPLLLQRLEAHRQRGSIDPAQNLEQATDVLVHLRLGLSAYGRLMFGLGSPVLKQLFETAGDVFARGLAPPR